MKRPKQTPEAQDVTAPFGVTKTYSFGTPEPCLAVLACGDGYLCLEHLVGLGHLSMFSIKKTALGGLQYRKDEASVEERAAGLKAKALVYGATLEAIQLLGHVTPLTTEEELQMAEAGTTTKLSRKSANKEELKAAAKAAPVAGKTKAAPKAAAAPKAEKPKEAKAAGGRKSTIDDGAKLKVLAKANPYREGSKAHATFELFKEHDTVGAAREAATADHDMGYLRYASRDGHIKIG